MREHPRRSCLAKAPFQAVPVKDGHVVSVLLRQEFQPYFVLAEMEQPPREGAAVLHESLNGRARGDWKHSPQAGQVAEMPIGKKPRRPTSPIE